MPGRPRGDFPGWRGTVEKEPSASAVLPLVPPAAWPPAPDDGVYYPPRRIAPTGRPSIQGLPHVRLSCHTVASRTEVGMSAILLPSRRLRVLSSSVPRGAGRRACRLPDATISSSASRAAPPNTISSPTKTVGDPLLAQWISAFLLCVAQVHEHGFVESPVWPSCVVFVRKGSRHSPPARGLGVSALFLQDNTLRQQCSGRAFITA